MDGGERREPAGVAVLTALVHGNIHALEHIFPVVLPLLLVEFDGSVALFGAVGTAAYMTMGLGGFPAGWIADRLGSKRTLVLCTGLCGAGCVLVAVAPTAGLVAAALALLGAGLGLYHPAGLSLLSRTYRSFHGWSLGIHGTGGAVAIVTAPFAFGAIAGLAGWRVAYLVAAGVSAALVVGLLFVREGEAPEAIPRKQEGPRRIGWKVFVVLLLETAFAGLVYRGVVTFLPLYYAGEVVPHLPVFVTDLLGSGGGPPSAEVAAALGGTLASITYAGSILGQTMGGWAASRKRYVVWLLVIGILFTALLTVMGLLGGFVVLVAGFFFALCYFAAQPITNMMVARYTKGRRHGLMYGIFFTSGFGTGALAPLIAGLLVVGEDLSRVFLLMAAIGGGSVIMRLVLLKMVGGEDRMNEESSRAGQEA